MISIFFLAFVQGITEFLPISSSAHLIIFRDLLLIGNNVINDNIKLTFDIALHFGTVLSIIYYFSRDLIDIVKKAKKGINDDKGKILWLVIVATFPAAIIGFMFEELIENYIRNKYLLIAISLIVMGIIMYLIDIKSKQNKTIEQISIIDSIIIGFSQVFALIPGFSRSGTTIVVARSLKINREDAAKFSFYLSIPIVLGAVLLKLFKINYSILISYYGIFILGILISFTTGLLSIKYLLKYLKNNNFKIFMWYRLVIGTLIIVYLIKK